MWPCGLVRIEIKLQHSQEAFLENITEIFYLLAQQIENNMKAPKKNFHQNQLLSKGI